MPYVPPWLSVTPQSFAESYANGVRAGLAASAQRQQAAQAAARMAQIDAEERRREWETQQRFALESQGLQQRRELGLENLRAQQAWRDASMGVDRERLAELNRHNIAAELNAQNKLEADVMPEEWDRDPNKAYITKGGAYIAPKSLSPQEVETITETLPPVEAVPAVPADTGKRSLLGIDWLRKDVPPTAAQPAVPAMGERRITRRVPIISSSPVTNAPMSASPYKEGDKIRSKVDGKIYIVRNGEPVLMEGQ